MITICFRSQRNILSGTDKIYKESSVRLGDEDCYGLHKHQIIKNPSRNYNKGQWITDEKIAQNLLYII